MLRTGPLRGRSLHPCFALTVASGGTGPGTYSGGLGQAYSGGGGVESPVFSPRHWRKRLNVDKGWAGRLLLAGCAVHWPVHTHWCLRLWRGGGTSISGGSWYMISIAGGGGGVVVLLCCGACRHMPPQQW